MLFISFVYRRLPSSFNTGLSPDFHGMQKVRVTQEMRVIFIPKGHTELDLAKECSVKAILDVLKPHLEHREF